MQLRSRNTIEPKAKKVQKNALTKVQKRVKKITQKKLVEPKEKLVERKEKLVEPKEKLVEPEEKLAEPKEIKRIQDMTTKELIEHFNCIIKYIDSIEMDDNNFSIVNEYCAMEVKYDLLRVMHRLNMREDIIKTCGIIEERINVIKKRGPFPVVSLDDSMLNFNDYLIYYMGALSVFILTC